jgi:thioredoxin 1
MTVDGGLSIRDPSRMPAGLICILVVTIVMGPACGRQGEASGSPAPGGSEIADGVPGLIDLGSHTCVPCRMMEGELERLGELAGDRLTVTFIDIYDDQAAATRYGVRVIPTQLFLAPDGSELYRHEGFMSAEQMLERWAALGYDLNAAAASDDP